MPSNKLSGRRTAACKPSICISIPPPLKYFEGLCGIHVTWTDYLATPPNVIVNQGVQAIRTAPDSPVFYYEDAAAGPSTIVIAMLLAPFDDTHCELTIHANDEGGATHLAYALFEPANTVPFSQTVELHSDDYPEAGSVIAKISPVPQ